MKELVLQPSFYKEFECIGGKCVNNCCHYKWNIDFTKEEFKNVKRRIHTEEFKEIFDDAFVYKKERGKFLVKFDDDNRCKFLNENGLCSMYKEVGPENMSQVCKIFPRKGLHYMKDYEYYLSPGCEEVVRFLTQEENGIRLEYVERELSDIEKQKADIWSAILADARPILYYYNDFKKLLFGVLQNRDYNFGERMVVLGIAMKKIDEMEEDGRVDNIPEYVENFVTDFNDEKNKEMYCKLFEKIDRNGQKRAINVLSYIRTITSKEIDEKVFERIDYRKIANFKQNNMNKFTAEIEREYNNEKYANAIADFEQFLKGKEHWIENIMLEGFLYTRAPFLVEGSIWENYVTMVMMYSIFLFYLTCYLEKDSTKEDFMYIVSKLSRFVFHNSNFFEHLKKVAKKNESNTLAHMAMLVL